MADIDPSYGGYAVTNKLLATAFNGPEAQNAWAQNRILQIQEQTARRTLGALNDVVSSVITEPSTG